MFRLFFIILIFIGVLIISASLFADLLQKFFPFPQPVINPTRTQLLIPAPTLTPTTIIAQPADSKLISGIPFVYQNFNNCGPAALSMNLSFYGINVPQQTLADIIRPYNNPQGFNDDKSVTLEEFGPVAKEHHLIFYHRPNGTTSLIKMFLANDIPVLTRTWLKDDDYIGHFRLITGFNESTQEFVQMDSIEGSRRFSYSQFLKLWQPFNYEYAVIAPPEKENIIRAILGPEITEQAAWSKAKQRAEEESKNNPQNLYPHFNLAVSLYHLGNYPESVRVFSEIRPKLPIKMLWYQLEPVQSYYEIKDYNQTLTLTEQIFQSGNPAFSESYIIRGDSYLALGNKDAARSEYQKASLYNKNLPLAKEKLANLSSTRL